MVFGLELQFFRTMESLGYVLYHSEMNLYSDSAYELAYIHSSLVGL